MKLLYLYLVFLSYIASNGYAQDSCLVSGAMRKLFIEPAALVDLFDIPSARIGAEISLSHSVSVIATAGIPGYYFNAGVKKYGLLPKSPGTFFEINAFYKNNGYTVDDNMTITTNNASNGNTGPGPGVEYKVTKKVYGVGFQIGGEITSRRHFYLEWFAGIGIRLRNVGISIPDSVQTSLYHYSNSMTDNLNNTPITNSLSISVPTGFRMGVHLQKKIYSSIDK